MFRRGVPALGAVLALGPVAVVWDSLPAAPAAPAGVASKANSNTTLSMAALVGSTSPTFRAKVIGVPSGTAAPTGSVSFAVNGFGPLQCDGLSDTVSMSGGVATCKVTSALPASGSPETAQATYSGDGNFTASGGTFTASGGSFHPNDGNPAPVVPLVVTPPASIPDDCSSDAAPALLSWLSSLPPGTASKPVVVKLPALACYAVNESLHIQNSTNLTIDGDGSTIVQPVAATDNGLHPILFLTQDTGLTIKNLNINGAYDGTNGGVGREGSYGIQMEADHGVTLTGLTVSNIQGDFMTLQPPYGLDGDQSLNTDIAITGSTFTNAGYHGLTVESANGLTVSGDTFTGMGPDAMDFEYDIYSTSIVNGQAQWAAEDNITIGPNNTWSNFSSDWLASLQGQVPGVQEQHVTLTGNTINNSAPLIQILGTNPADTTAPYVNSHLTITNNTATQPALPTHGGSIATQWPGSAMEVQYVAAVNVSNNVFPMFDGTCTLGLVYFCDTPYIAAIRVWGSNGLTIMDNVFNGALGVLYPPDPTSPVSVQAAGASGDNAAVTQCGNSYGVNAAQLDATCASTG